MTVLRVWPAPGRAIRLVRDPTGSALADARACIELLSASRALMAPLRVDVALGEPVTDVSPYGGPVLDTASLAVEMVPLGITRGSARPDPAREARESSAELTRERLTAWLERSHDGTGLEWLTLRTSATRVALSGSSRGDQLVLSHETGTGPVPIESLDGRTAVSGPRDPLGAQPPLAVEFTRRADALFATLEVHWSPFTDPTSAAFDDVRHLVRTAEALGWTLDGTTELARMAATDPSPTSAEKPAPPDEIAVEGGRVCLGLDEAERLRLAARVVAMRTATRATQTSLRGYDAWDPEVELGRVVAKLATAAPPRVVALAPFRIARRPVTRREWATYEAAAGARPSERPGAGDFAGAGGDLAVEVTFDEATAYARFRGLALPSQAEWEHAARGSARRVSPWDDDGSLESDAWVERLAHVAALESPRGLQGLLSATGEWCADLSEDLPDVATSEGGGETGPAPTIRGVLVADVHLVWLHRIERAPSVLARRRFRCVRR